MPDTQIDKSVSFKRRSTTRIFFQDDLIPILNLSNTSRKMENYMDYDPDYKDADIAKQEIKAMD